LFAVFCVGPQVLETVINLDLTEPRVLRMQCVQRCRSDEFFSPRNNVSKTLACRCEDVTLEELVHAIEKGHNDLESLKRYTGFGTGFCQGKNCIANCARELNLRGGFAELPFTPRPPYHPVEFGLLAALDGAVLAAEEMLPTKEVSSAEEDSARAQK
jgi:bacterioferritin-associated ferredoxin